MKRLIAILILVPLAIIVVALSVANRHAVTLSLDPFNGEAPVLALTMPLFVLIFATLAVGTIIGGVATWLGQGRWRRQARAMKREARTVRRENEQFRTVTKASPATTLPTVRSNAA
ncbi:lipopolysaccharide assembly protein LapA domain-containing protein [Kaistia dalseonensis]|uniref:Uncharacterized membrane protein YciS (DUF1049 family) n=1 Tax=Kaistia dalseonensis TaxID=410840 RepID=A0ABU0H5E1_9HYPH|nr:lipopolysaccharide assembly protein LapA domain-containing protein [Kaistia dalseonensis]MCX5494940.1 lipopolysaccharide assembly protein LapA domain-containing protein [Kaistia dalseonensis]MDQ0437521.1 uncharacterized membrane protein YciS (DUF1049 family) [Kaistia dalseonensis]